MTEIFGSNPFNIVPHLAALATAYALAFPIGWNREREERSAGLRTFPLVAVATCGMIQAAESAMATSPEAMARIIEGLITGMGFIGGGAILRMKDSVRGTATAASLWITGAIGIARWARQLRRRGAAGGCDGDHLVAAVAAQEDREEKPQQPRDRTL